MCYNDEMTEVEVSYTLHRAFHTMGHDLVDYVGGRLLTLCYKTQAETSKTMTYYGDSYIYKDYVGIGIHTCVGDNDLQVGK